MRSGSARQGGQYIGGNLVTIAGQHLNLMSLLVPLFALLLSGIIAAQSGKAIRNTCVRVDQL